MTELDDLISEAARADRAVHPPDSARELATKRLEGKRNLTAALIAYLVVNAFLIGVWAMTGAGSFWPAWILAGWGMALVLGAWDVFGRRPITEADIRREIERQQR